jgi:Family of unknown function (DUF6941)
MSIAGRVSVIAVFCESVRQEVGGQSILGIMSDNIKVPRFPGAFTDLAIYARVHYAPESAPSTMALAMKNPWNEQDYLRIEANPSDISRGAEEAKAMGAPITGHILFAKISNFAVTGPGRLNAMVEVDGESILAATLNIFLAQSDDLPTDS